MWQNKELAGTEPTDAESMGLIDANISLLSESVEPIDFEEDNQSQLQDSQILAGEASPEAIELSTNRAASRDIIDQQPIVQTLPRSELSAPPRVPTLVPISSADLDSDPMRLLTSLATIVDVLGHLSNIVEREFSTNSEREVNMVRLQSLYLTANRMNTSLTEVLDRYRSAGSSSDGRRENAVPELVADAAAPNYPANVPLPAAGGASTWYGVPPLHPMSNYYRAGYTHRYYPVTPMLGAHYYERQSPSLPRASAPPPFANWLLQPPPGQQLQSAQSQSQSQVVNNHNNNVLAASGDWTWVPQANATEGGASEEAVDWREGNGNDHRD